MSHICSFRLQKSNQTGPRFRIVAGMTASSLGVIPEERTCGYSIKRGKIRM